MFQVLFLSSISSHKSRSIYNNFPIKLRYRIPTVSHKFTMNYCQYFTGNRVLLSKVTVNSLQNRYDWLLAITTFTTFKKSPMHRTQMIVVTNDMFVSVLGNEETKDGMSG